MLNNNQQTQTGPAMPVAARIFLGLWMSAIIIGAFLYLPPLSAFPSPETARIIVFHVPCAIVAVILFVVSAVYAVVYLKNGKPLCDDKSAISAALGLTFTALATITGMIFALKQWNKAWNWDPKQVTILMLMALYAAYFMLRSAIPNRVSRAKICASYNIIAAIIMPYLMFVLPSKMASLHPTGTLTTSGGLSPQYRMVFGCAVVGYILVSLWIFRIQVRVAELTSAARRNKIER